MRLLNLHTCTPFNVLCTKMLMFSIKTKQIGSYICILIGIYHMCFDGGVGNMLLYGIPHIYFDNI